MSVSVFKHPPAGLCAEFKDVTQHKWNQQDSDLAGESDRSDSHWGRRHSNLGRGLEEKQGACSHREVRVSRNDSKPEIRSCRAVTGAQPSG